MTVLMAGCGDLGTEVGLRLAAVGHHVVGARRTPDRLPEALARQKVDLSRERPAVTDDTTIVIVTLTAPRTARDYQSTYVNGLRHVLDAIDDSAANPRVVFVSSTAVYGVSDGSWVDEDSPTNPTSATGQVLLEAEQLLHRRRTEATALRLAGLYGPGRGMLLTKVRNGSALIPATPTFTNRIHRDDAAAAIVHLATAVDTPAPTYIGVDDAPTERAELLRFLAHQMGAEEPAIASDSSDRSAGKRCRNDRLRGTGFEFHFPTYREGYRAILAEQGPYEPQPEPVRLSSGSPRASAGNAAGDHGQ